MPSRNGQRTYRHTYRWRTTVRSEVLRRDGHACRFCGWPGTDGHGRGLQLAHIVDHDLGGSDDASNLIALCPRDHAAYDADKRSQRTSQP